MDNQTSHHKQKDEGFRIDEQQAGFVMGAVVGALVGGAAALLLSPKNGQEMRAIVKKYSKDLEQEAHELAKDARGTAVSFKSVLQEGATEVIEQAPEKIEQAGYQAQQLADELSQKFESARDVVAELADAFKSGWEEYGDSHPDDELRAAPSLLEEDDVSEVVKPFSHEQEVELVQSKVEDKVEVEDEQSEPVVALHSRRRTQSSSHYSMHATPKSDKVAEDVEEKSVAHSRQESKSEENEPKKSAEASSYTTRVLDEPKKVEPVKPRVKAEEAPAKKEEAPKKKLLFRRSGK